MIVRWGTLFLGTLAAAAVIGSSAGAQTGELAPVTLHVSSSAQIQKILASHGIDPKGVVVQHGVWNYAGPSCPGFGWTCTTAKVVVQFGPMDGINQFQCSPSNAAGGSATSPGDCTIVQVSTGANNDARCFEQAPGGPTPPGPPGPPGPPAPPHGPPAPPTPPAPTSTTVTQSCTIFQTNTTGDNHLDINEQVNANGGWSQDATQYAGTEQTTGGNGHNDAHIQQQINENTNDTDPTGAQTQEGHQGVSVDQTSDSGDNHADVNQSLAENAHATSAIVSQNQDTDGSSGPNTNAGITQTSNTGRNDAHLNQSNDLDGTASKWSNGSQTQGAPTDGLNGHFDQNSTGVSTAHVTQQEHQDLNLDGGPPPPGPPVPPPPPPKKGAPPVHLPPPPPPTLGVVTQTQYGPHWAGSPQYSNPNNQYTIDQNSDQHASNPTLQDNQGFSNCDTSGNCTTHDTIHQNGGQPYTTSCTGQSCHVGQHITTGPNGTTTTTCTGLGDSDTNGFGGSCAPPPPPPPPAGGLINGCGDRCDISPTETTVESSEPDSYQGQTVTFTATVTPSSATGTVTFTSGDTTLCSAVPLENDDAGDDVATCTTQSLTSDGSPYTITGTYSGDGSHSGSSGTAVQTVHPG